MIHTVKGFSGEKLETLTDFIFLGSKIILDGDCSHEIKRLLLLKKTGTKNLDSILNVRDKGPYSQIYSVSSSHVWIWELDYKTTESQRTDAFELWCWKLERTFESP